VVPTFEPEHWLPVASSASSFVNTRVLLVPEIVAVILYATICRPAGMLDGSAQHTVNDERAADVVTLAGSFGWPTTTDGSSVGPLPAAFVAEMESTYVLPLLKRSSLVPPPSANDSNLEIVHIREAHVQVIPVATVVPSARYSFVEFTTY
jgi:hypothetical protein